MMSLSHSLMAQMKARAAGHSQQGEYSAAQSNCSFTIGHSSFIRIIALRASSSGSGGMSSGSTLPSSRSTSFSRSIPRCAA